MSADGKETGELVSTPAALDGLLETWQQIPKGHNKESEAAKMVAAEFEWGSAVRAAAKAAGKFDRRRWEEELRDRQRKAAGKLSMGRRSKDSDLAFQAALGAFEVLRAFVKDLLPGEVKHSEYAIAKAIMKREIAEPEEA